MATSIPEQPDQLARQSAAARPWQDWVGLAARLILGGVLLYAGLTKIGDLEQSVNAVRAYQIFGHTMSQIIGYGLPVVEIIVGLLLIAGLFTRVTGAIGGLMMLAFIAGIASAWARGLSLDCGCFGNGGEIAPEDTTYLLDIVRDVGLLACGAWLAWRPKTPFSLDNWLFATPTFDDDFDDSED